MHIRMREGLFALLLASTVGTLGCRIPGVGGGEETTGSPNGTESGSTGGAPSGSANSSGGASGGSSGASSSGGVSGGSNAGSSGAAASSGGASGDSSGGSSGANASGGSNGGSGGGASSGGVTGGSNGGSGGASSGGAASGGSSSGGVVTLSSISITPNPTTVAISLQRVFTATGVYSDGTSQDITAAATWASTDETLATVDTTGTATGVAAGQVTITASLDGVTGSALLTVVNATVIAVDVTPVAASIARGTTQAFTATARFSDGTSQDVTSLSLWSTSSTMVASVDVNGLATGNSVGTADVYAEYDSIRGTATLDVTAAVLTQIMITPAAPRLALGTTVNLVATGLYSDGSTQNLTTQVTWVSVSPAVATVSDTAPTKGHVQSIATGTASITASLASITGSTTVTVTNATLTLIDVFPLDVQLAVGTGQQFVAIGEFSDGSTQDVTTQATWTVVPTAGSTAPVASVTTTGFVTAANAGTADVRAVLSGITGVATLTVSNATLLSIAVEPVDPTAAVSTTLPFIATGTFSDGTTQDITASVTWSSSDQAVATISNVSPDQGVASALSAGTTVVSATLMGITGSTTLTVSTAVLVSITVVPSSTKMPVGLYQRFRAVGTFSDGSTQDVTTLVTWTSADAAIVSVSNAAGTQGQATGVAVGTTVVTATRGLISGTATADVVDAQLVSIAVTPGPTLVLVVGQTQQMTATGTYDDLTNGGTFTFDITTQARWKSTKRNFVSINNLGVVRGRRAQGMASTSNVTAIRDRITSNAVVVSVVP